MSFSKKSQDSMLKRVSEKEAKMKQSEATAVNHKKRKPVLWGEYPSWPHLVPINTSLQLSLQEGAEP